MKCSKIVLLKKKRESYYKNLEYERTRSARYYADHRDEILKRRQKHYLKNLDRERMRALEYYYKNRKAILEYNRKKRKALKS